MADDRGGEAIVVSHVAHILRDVFELTPKTRVVCYQGTEDLLYELRKPEHGVEAWGLHHGEFPEEGAEDNSLSHYWEIGYNDTYYGPDFCDLFVSVNYFQVHPELTVHTVVSLWKFMKPKGLLFLVNPQLNDPNFQWGNFVPRHDLVDEIKQYSMFARQNVLVLQNDI